MAKPPTEVGPGTAFMATSAAGFAASDDQPLQTGTRLGPWEIISPIESGGMGTVYRAERADGLYTQQVAIKFILGLDRVQVERFERERRQLAKLDHPAIASIIDGGTAEDGRLYMVMAFVDGSPLTSALDLRRASREERIGCFRQLCEAVAYCHEQLVLHRDIKPANVLLDRVGQVKLVDFGIATDLSQPRAESSRALTTRYAAPELLINGEASVRSDVFALGVLLHELLTGAAPSRGADGGVELVAGIGDADLAAIIHKAGAGNPEERYAATGGLLADIDAWRHSRPVGARNGGRIYRITKFLRRYPLSSGLALSTLLALTIGLGTSLSLGRAARQEAQRAIEALDQAQYQYRRADAFLRAQTVMNDLLQQAYAGDANNTDRVTATLVRRWRDLHDSWEVNPEDAAAMAFAVGRNFYSRRDFTSALEVLSEWLDAGYGTTMLRDAGATYYAIALHDSNRTAEALPLLRARLAAADTRWQPLADSFFLASRIASTTREVDDIEVATVRYEAYRAQFESESASPAELIDLYGSASSLYELAQDYAASVTALESLIAVATEYPDVAPDTRALARTHLARAKLYHFEDSRAAEQIARAILREDVPLVGTSLSTAHAYMLLGDALREQGQYDEALLALNNARSLNQRFVSGVSNGTVAENTMRARLYLDRGQADRAWQLLAAVEQEWRNSHPAEQPVPDILTLMQLWIDIELGSNRELLAAKAKRVLTIDSISPIHARWIYGRAVRAGLPDVLQVSSP